MNGLLEEQNILSGMYNLLMRCCWWLLMSRTWCTNATVVGVEYHWRSQGQECVSIAYCVLVIPSKVRIPLDCCFSYQHKCGCITYPQLKLWPSLVTYWMQRNLWGLCWQKKRQRWVGGSCGTYQTAARGLQCRLGWWWVALLGEHGDGWCGIAGLCNLGLESLGIAGYAGQRALYCCQRIEPTSFESALGKLLRHIWVRYNMSVGISGWLYNSIKNFYNSVLPTDNNHWDDATRWAS